jgi:type IV pilus assembly protein PilV
MLAVGRKEVVMAQPQSILGRQAHQTGVGLIEVLITLLILSIGLLGFATLQMRSMQLNQSAGFRTQVSAMAADIVDRMMVNRSAVDDYMIGIGDAAPTTAITSGDNDEVMASQDMLAWFTNVSALPSGDASIAQSSDGNQVIVTICWDDQRGGTDSINGAAGACGNSFLNFFQFSADI